MSASTSSVPEQGSIDKLDKSFGRMLVIGYAVGFVLVFGLMLVLLLAVTNIPDWAAVFASLAVAVQAGIMGAVIAIGPWTAHNEHELFHQ
jgi:hypothetical protein